MLKVEDRVRIRKDLEHGEYYGKQMYCEGYMEELRGKEGFIVREFEDMTYYIDIDKLEWRWTEEMLEKIEEKENNMKELTFREVIANIKDGEIWERVDSGYISDEIELKDGKLNQYNVWGGKINFTLGKEGIILDKTLYKLKRPQYTFQEAFKAFEEGKEIESCVNGRSYVTKGGAVEIKEDGETFVVLGKDYIGWVIKEIQGKWYINN